MNTEQIKAKVRNILSSSIGMIGRDTALKLLDALEAAERERDELRENLAVMDGHLSASRALKQLWKNRAWDAEEEIARRDAAAGEPVAWTDDNGLHLLKETSGVMVHPTQERGGNISLFTAAQPAVLPPKLSMDIDPELQGEFRVHESIRRKGFNQALDAALELGAKPQNPVVLPGRYDIEEMSGDPWQSYRCIEPDEDGEYMRRDEVLTALDAAGVPYEVKE